jgi:hypothetical protein
MDLFSYESYYSHIPTLTSLHEIVLELLSRNLILGSKVAGQKLHTSIHVCQSDLILVRDTPPSLDGATCQLEIMSMVKLLLVWVKTFVAIKIYLSITSQFSGCHI